MARKDYLLGSALGGSLRRQLPGLGGGGPFGADAGKRKGRGGWVAASELKPGDPVRLADGSTAYVTEVRKTERVEKVYNFTVEGFHTYHVGELGVWVHNTNCGEELFGVVGDFGVGKHGKMPRPRGGKESQHGVMSAYLKAKFPDLYDADLAPAILMPKANHNATKGVYLRWRSSLRHEMGGAFEWSKVSDDQIISLSNQMLDAASVPQITRDVYWEQYGKMLGALRNG